MTTKHFTSMTQRVAIDTARGFGAGPGSRLASETITAEAKRHGIAYMTVQRYWLNGLNVEDGIRFDEGAALGLHPHMRY